MRRPHCFIGGLGLFLWQSLCLAVPPNHQSCEETEGPPFLALVEAGTSLSDIHTKQMFKTEKDFYAHFFDRGEVACLLDQQNNGRYLVAMKALVRVDKILDLSLVNFPVYKVRRHFGTSTDRLLSLEHSFLFSVEAIETTLFPNLFWGRNKGAVAYKMRSRHYPNFSFPLSFGFYLHYERGAWEDPQPGVLTWDALFLGPSFRWKIFQHSEMALSSHISVGHSLFHESEKGVDRHSYTSILAQGDLEMIFRTSNMGFLFGLGVSRMHSRMRSSTELTNNSSQWWEQYALGVSVGYVYEWSL